MVLDPAHDDQRTWLKFASLCRKSGRLALSHKTLVSMLGVDPSKSPESAIPTHYPQVSISAKLYHVIMNIGNVIGVVRVGAKLFVQSVAV
jgi:FKBP12-rapamycin complex-associated protein